jgi:tRNA(Ile)-lysidine synthase
LASRLDVDFDYARLDLPPAADELSMRNSRYAALLAIAGRQQASLVLTAHHADDNLETVLFRLLRGTGLRGLRGIPEARQLGDGVLLARPFLNVRKNELFRVLQEAALSSWEDPSNLDLGKTRNFLRHCMIPELRKKMGMRLDSSLVAISRSAHAVGEMLSGHAEEILGSHGKAIAPWRFELGLSDLSADDQPFLGEALRMLHEEMSTVAPKSRWLERAAAMLHATTGQRLLAGGELLLERTQSGLLVLNVNRAGSPPEEPLSFSPGPQSMRFGSTEWQLSARYHDSPPLDPSPQASGRFRALLDAESIKGGLFLRIRKPRDQFWPLGAQTPVDLRRFLQGRHVPRFDRDRLPLLVDSEDRILWTPGVEIAENAKLRPDSGPCIEIFAQRAG